MNRDHLFAFVWLRWRLKVNQFKRGGSANTVLLAVVAVLLGVAALGSAVGGYLVGAELLGESPASAVMLVWDGALVTLLFVWLTGLVASIQRAEGLALDKVMHLPVSPAGAFTINYLSSLANLTLGVFVPGFLALTLGLAVSRGPLMLLTLLPLAAFVFALTAVTYQFQGWLASLMGNPRRRRTVIVAATLGFILLAQAPQLFNIARMGGGGRDPEREAAREANDAEVAEARAASEVAKAEADAELQKSRVAADADNRAGNLTSQQYGERLEQGSRRYKERLDRIGADHAARMALTSENYKARLTGTHPDAVAAKAGRNRAQMEQVSRAAWAVNAVVPPGWLPLAAGSLAEGNPLPALLGSAGLAAIGLVSLRRAYRTTLRMYSGADAGGEAARAESAPQPVAGPPKLLMAEWRLPLVGEHVSAVASAGLRSLLRAPEAKMVLLAPLMLAVMFGAVAATTPLTLPELARPLVAAAGAGMVLLAAVQVMGNQFGFDRGGFRAYVLAPIDRRDILLGKNLAAAPLILGLALGAVLAVGVVLPMRIDHFLGAACQAVALYLVVAMLANALSVLSPMAIAPGAMQPGGGLKAGQVFGQLLCVLLLPVAAAPTFLPLGAEAYLAEYAGMAPRVPVALAGSVLVLALTAAVYWRVLGAQGRMLWEREQEVLRVVTSKEE